MSIIKRKAMMFVISSPSGAGKTTIAQALTSLDDKIKISISATTRPKRHNEVHGKDYFFVSDAEFEEMKNKGLLLESAEVFGYKYGTPLEQTMEYLNNDIDVLYDVDWRGAEQIAEKYPEFVVKLFILPPSMEVLEDRLRNRASDNEDTILRRLSDAKEEIKQCVMYDYVIVNEHVEETLDNVRKCLHAERSKVGRLNVRSFVDRLLSVK